MSLIQKSAVIADKFGIELARVAVLELGKID